MQRLIVELKEPLNASFCEDIVKFLGKCELTPLTENYCVLEGFKMDYSQSCFEKLLQFTEQSTNRVFLASEHGDLDLQLYHLQKCNKNIFMSEFEPPNLHSKHCVSEELWIILGIQVDDFE